MVLCPVWVTNLPSQRGSGIWPGLELNRTEPLVKPRTAAEYPDPLITLAMTEEDAKAGEKLWMEQAKGRGHLDAECTADKVEQEAAWCQEAMGNVLDTMAKKITICAKSKRWWNADICERRKVVGWEHRRRWNSEEAAKVKAEFQKSIQQSKRKMLSEYSHNLRGAEYGEQHDTRTLGQA